MTEGPRRAIINLDAWEETPPQYIGVQSHTLLQKAMNAVYDHIPVHYTSDLTTASADSEYNHIRVHPAIHGNTLSEEGVSTASTRQQHAIHGSTLSEEHVSNAATRRQHAIHGARYTTELKVFTRWWHDRNNKLKGI